MKVSVDDGCHGGVVTISVCLSTLSTLLHVHQRNRSDDVIIGNRLKDKSATTSGQEECDSVMLFI